MRTACTSVHSCVAVGVTVSVIVNLLLKRQLKLKKDGASAP